MMTPTELLQRLGNLSMDERTGERDHSVLFDLYTHGRIDAQTISNWLESVEIGQMGHFLGLELNIRAYNDVEYGSQEYTEFVLVMEHVRRLVSNLVNSFFRNTRIATTAEISEHKPEYATYIDHVEHYSPQFANTRTTESEIDEMWDCLLQHRAHALNQPWGTYDYQRATETPSGIGNGRCWSCYRRGIIHEVVQESLEVTNNSSDDQGSDNDSYGYSDYTMGTGDTDQSSQGESDLGDSNISL
jgi:hypothetical protein